MGGLIEIPPDGAISAAGATLRVQGAGSLTPLAGPAAISDFTIALTVDANVFGAVVTGFLTATQNGPAFGVLSAGLAGLQLTQTLLLDATGFFDCSGALCGLVGTFPATVNGTQSLPPPISLTLNGLATLGAAQVGGTLLLSLAGQTALPSLVGTEVSRTFVPEPLRIAQLAAAAVLLALLWRRRR